MPVLLLNTEHVLLRNTQSLSCNSKLVFSCCCCCCSHVRVNLFTFLLFQKKKQEQIFVKLKHHALALCASAPLAHTGQRHSTTTLAILRLNFPSETALRIHTCSKSEESFSFTAAKTYSYTLVTLGSYSYINQSNVSCKIRLILGNEEEVIKSLHKQKNKTLEPECTKHVSSKQ